jgi:hypothetical protein
MTLNKALSKSPEFAHIDIQDGGNTCGVFLFKRQLLHLHKGKPKKMVKHFLFFPDRKHPIFHKESYVWSDIYDKSAQLKLAARSKTARTVTPPTPIDHDDGPATFLLSPSPPRKKTQQSQSNAVPPKRFDIFNDKRTKTLFNITNRAAFHDRIHRMREALQHHTITSFLSKPHMTRKSEPLPEYNTIALHSKILLLTMAYEIAYEEYSIHVSWMDCCTEATKRMHAISFQKQ